MKLFRRLVLTIAGMAVWFGAGPRARAQSTDHQIPYQGRLELGGLAVSGAYNFQFELYTSDTFGDCGYPGQVGDYCAWVDELLGVQVVGGAFSVVLGSATNPLGDAIWQNPEVFLAIRVAASGDAYTPLTGRQRILAVPLAARAETALDYRVTGALVVDGGATITGATTITGGTTLNGNAAVSGNATIGGTLSVGGNVTGLTVTLVNCAWFDDACETNGTVIYLDRAADLACPANQVLVDWNVSNCGGNYSLSFRCCGLAVQ